MMMEVMGLHVPGAAFVNPGTQLRQALTRAAVHRLAMIGWDGERLPPARPSASTRRRSSTPPSACWPPAVRPTTPSTCRPSPARRGSSSTGRTSTPLSAAAPLIARVYPNGSGDVNAFHAAGGMAFVIATLLEAGLLHRDVMTVWDGDLGAYARTPRLEGDALAWDDAPGETGDETMLRPTARPFAVDGGMRLVSGNLGRAIFKTSAVDPERWTIEAPARIFGDQDEVLAAFKAGELDRDMAVVVRFQGPRANGMPELHKLTPALGVLQDRGRRVALITDGRMSGASGKVPAAIHVTPEALGGGPLARLRDGDVVRLCGQPGPARGAGGSGRVGRARAGDRSRGAPWHRPRTVRLHARRGRRG